MNSFDILWFFAFLGFPIKEICAQIYPMPRYNAIARLRTADQNEYLVGQIELVQYAIGGPTTILGVLNLPPYSYNSRFLAMHIHEYGDVSNACRNVGQHFNPNTQVHGAPLDIYRHVGDLGNIAPNGNIALVNITDRNVQLAGYQTVIGRTIVLHVNQDDYGKGGTQYSLVDGNSGYPIACGVIGIKGNFSPAAGSWISPLHSMFYLIFASLSYFISRKFI